MNYNQTLNYLYQQLPMFHRIGAAAYKADLDNTHAICRVLDHPEKKFKSIHVAGTNGKGSTSHMLAAIFQQAGYKTGLYTSPHLKDFRERIKINGSSIPKRKVIDFVKKYRRDFERIKPSFFEWTVGLAFDHFSSQKVDIAIIETGLGGRLDSTNVIMPEVSLITNIGYDHMQLLGNTLQKIATEKAGIIKPHTPIVISETQKGIKEVFKKTAAKKSTKIVFADKHFAPLKSIYIPAKQSSRFYYKKGKKVIQYVSDLGGTYQEKNIAGVLTVIDILRSSWKIKETHIFNGLKNIKKLTGLRGRWDLIRLKPKTIADTGHNTDGLKEVIKCIDREYETRQVKGKLHVVFGAVNDKDLAAVFTLLKKNEHFKKASYYFCKPSIPRGMDTSILMDAGREYGLSCKAYASVKRALAAARRSAKQQELVFVGGSTFTVAEIV